MCYLTRQINYLFSKSKLTNLDDITGKYLAFYYLDTKILRQ